jgi:hypothetical protein
MTETPYSEWWAEHRDRVEQSDDVRIDVFVRSLGAPTASQTAQRTVFERLDRLEEQDRIDRFTVQVWGDRLYPEERCAELPVGRFLHDKVDEFRQWANAHQGVELPFESTVCDPFVDDGTFECIKLPQICLATYVDGELSSVVPCRFEGRDLSASKYLTALEELARDPLPANRESGGVTTVTGS